MPTVPLYQQNQQMKPSLGLPRRAPEGIGAAWENLGNKLGVAASDIQRRAQERKETQDNIDVLNAFSDFRDSERQYRFESKQRKGKDARGITQDFKVWSEKTYGEISKSLSPSAANKFKEVYQKHIDQQLDEVANRENVEFGNYQDDTAKRGLSEAAGGIAETPDRAKDIIAEYEKKLDIIYNGNVPAARKMEDRAQLLGQGAEDLAAQGRFKEALAVVDNNKKILGSQYSPIKTKITAFIAAEDKRRDQEAEKILEDRQKNNEKNIYLAIRKQQANPGATQDRVTLQTLNDAIAVGDIDQSAHDRMWKLLDDPEGGEDDPYFLALVAKERDPIKRYRLLDQGLSSGVIRNSTYISKIEKIENEEYKDGEEYVSRVMRPGLAYEGATSQGFRYAEAMEQYDGLVGRGIPPLAAAKRVVKQYINNEMIDARSIGRPTYMPDSGDVTNLKDIEQAENETLLKYIRNEIVREDYDIEMNKIRRLKDKAYTIQDYSKQSELTDDELKQIQTQKAAQ